MILFLKNFHKNLKFKKFFDFWVKFKNRLILGYEHLKTQHKHLKTINLFI